MLSLPLIVFCSIIFILISLCITVPILDNLNQDLAEQYVIIFIIIVLIIMVTSIGWLPWLIEKLA